MNGARCTSNQKFSIAVFCLLSVLVHYSNNNVWPNAHIDLQNALYIADFLHEVYTFCIIDGAVIRSCENAVYVFCFLNNKRVF